MIDFDNFPKFSEEDFKQWITELTPIEEHSGYSVKRDDLFNLGGISGGKVRQCAKLVYDNLDFINEKCNGGILTASGIPSPQSCIVSAVAKYFGLKCIITIPYYPNHIIDSFWVNGSLSHRFGAKVYGCGNPNTSGPELDAKYLVQETGYFQVKFGMNGKEVIETISNQVENVPDYVDTIVGIAGSGLSMLGVAKGCKKFNKNVKDIYAVSLSNYIIQNKSKWYDTLEDNERFDGNFNIVNSNFPYQYKLKLEESLPLDQTYEAKAWEWMTNNLKPEKNILFWDVGIKEYDLNYIQEINWYKSEYERILDTETRQKHKVIEHNFFNE